MGWFLFGLIAGAVVWVPAAALYSMAQPFKWDNACHRYLGWIPWVR